MVELCRPRALAAPASVLRWPPLVGAAKGIRLPGFEMPSGPRSRSVSSGWTGSRAGRASVVCTKIGVFCIEIKASSGATQAGDSGNQAAMSSCKLAARELGCPDRYEAASASESIGAKVVRMGARIAGHVGTGRGPVFSLGRQCDRWRSRTRSAGPASAAARNGESASGCRHAARRVIAVRRAETRNRYS
jgi:hypothetical protein